MGQERKFKFAFVDPSVEIAGIVRNCSDPLKEDLIIKVVPRDAVVSVAKRLLNEGAEIVIGHGETGRFILESTGQSVVSIPRTHLDLLCAFLEAKSYSSPVGLASFSVPTDGIEILQQVLGIKVREIVYNTTEELITGIYQLVEQGIECIVGGEDCRKKINELGGKGIITLPRKEAVLRVFREARAIAAARRRELENAERIRTILQMIDEGVIGIDDYGRINIYNEMAERILGLSLKNQVGQSLPKISRGFKLIDVLSTGNPEIDVIKKIGNVNIILNSLPININGRTKGAVALVKEATRIQDIDRKIKEQLYTKGFASKYTVEHIKGQSLKIKQVVSKAKKYARTDATILIQGETGTGKELLAHSIHSLGNRKGKPFVAVNCAALPESLLESEVFGYEEGAFTGAKRGGKIGLFELSNKGTIFLDEIGDIPPSLQIRLLRVLEEKEVMRVGGDRIVPVDVRIISSSGGDLREEVKLGKFRAELYFRLAILKLDIPPLRDRLEDIPYILKGLLKRYKKSTKAISPQMLNRMKMYHWPGNIRELCSFIESYLILLGDSESNEYLFLDLLDGLMKDGATTVKEPSVNVEGSRDSSLKTLREQLGEYERPIIEKALMECQYNRKETAKRLGISVNTLWRKLQF